MIGGAAAALSSAYNIAANWADKRVGLYFPRGRPLGGHHPRVWEAIRRKLLERGVELHPRHRAIVPVGFACDRTTDDVVTWSGGQTRTTADTALWTIGRVLPNTRSLPSEILDDAGFVQTTSYLRVPGYPGVYAIGDVAATDELRSSARNRADRIIAHNIRADFAGGAAKEFVPPARRWGSVLGAQPEGLDVFDPRGARHSIPAWLFERVVKPVYVRQGIYRGIRRPRTHGFAPAAPGRT